MVTSTSNKISAVQTRHTCAAYGSLALSACYLGAYKIVFKNNQTKKANFFKKICLLKFEYSSKFDILWSFPCPKKTTFLAITPVSCHEFHFHEL